jgi:hemerythrin
VLIDKSDLPLVDMEFMNDVHLEDIDIINDIFGLIIAYDREPNENNKIKLNQKYQEWIEHTKEHFNGEEVLMIEKGFPPYPMHKGEHDNALRGMQDIFDEWNATQDISLLKIYFIEQLPAWLINHINTMDTVTARFFKSGLSPCAMHH